MFFVPVVPPQPPSPRTRELADLLGRVIEEYEKHHPAVTGSEVRAAMEMATRSSKADGRSPSRKSRGSPRWRSSPASSASRSC